MADKIEMDRDGVLLKGFSIAPAQLSSGRLLCLVQAGLVCSYTLIGHWTRLVLNLLLQVLDDRCLTGAMMRVVDFTNAIVVMTSHAGSQKVLRVGLIGFSRDGPGVGRAGGIGSSFREALRWEFRPEFLNRIDDIIFFNPLGWDELRSIVDLQVEYLRAHQAEANGIRLEVTEEARELLVEQGFEREYGARPLRRAIRRLMKDPLAVPLLEGRFGEGDTIRVDRDGDALSFKKVKGKRRNRKPDAAGARPLPAPIEGSPLAAPPA